MRGAAWQGNGGQLGVFLRTYLRDVGGLGAHCAGALRHTWCDIKAQKIQVANVIIIFLLECSDYKK